MVISQNFALFPSKILTVCTVNNYLIFRYIPTDWGSKAEMCNDALKYNDLHTMPAKVPGKDSRLDSAVLDMAYN